MSTIKIKKSKVGTFTKAAKAHGKTVSQFEKQVLSNKDNYSPAMVKKANFSRNAKKWHHGQDGLTMEGPMLPTNMENMNPYNWIPTTTQIQPMEEKKPNKQINWGNVATTGLLAIDALLPEDKPKLPVVRPQLIYNENPYGTGSQAIAKKGLTISQNGYKRTSKDKNKKALRIPSNQITMKDVPHPVLGVDNKGNAQVMLPEQDYTYPGDYVDEYPIAKDGHWIQGAVNPKHKGYCTPMTKSTCTPRRKAFAKTMKKHHGFHRDGGTVYQNGGQVFTSQQQLDYANAEARRFGKAHSLDSPSTLHVGTKIGDPIPQYYDQFGKPLQPAKTKSLPTTVPSYVKRSDIYNENGAYWYIDNDGNVVDVDKSVVSLPQFKTDMEKAKIDLANRANAVASLEHGGSLSAEKAKEMLRDGTAHGKKLTKRQKRYFAYKAYAEDGTNLSPIYEEGGEYDISEEEYNNLLKQGYKMQIL